MSFRVELTETAKKELKKLEKHTAALIVGWMRKILKAAKMRVSTAKDSYQTATDNGGIA